MTTIELAAPWTYRTPEKTINYPAGTHEVFQYVADQVAQAGFEQHRLADQAEAEGALNKKEEADGDTDQLATPRKALSARPRKG